MAEKVKKSKKSEKLKFEKAKIKNITECLFILICYNKNPFFQKFKN